MADGRSNPLTGPLMPYRDGFGGELSRLGFLPNAAAQQLVLFGSLSRWLGSTGRRPGDLDDDAIAEFVAWRRRAGFALHKSVRALTPMLEFLRGLGVVPTSCPPAPAGVVEALLERYHGYLVFERGMTSGAARSYVDYVRPLIFPRVHAGMVDLRGLMADDLDAFVLAASRRLAPHSVGCLVSALRSFLGFAHLTGLIDSPMALLVPSVAYHPPRPARGLPPADVNALLDSCDRGRRDGRRDYAMLLLMIRLGLRAGEVAALDLEDIDWKRGRISVTGKGGGAEWLPLPPDVGEAVADWCRLGRTATTAGRTVFTRVRAPHTRLSTGGVTQAVAAASRRAGLPRIHAHRLRHTAATSMLSAGLSLQQIGLVLRHRSMLTTSIYAKVDFGRLSMLVRPWPGSR